MSYLPRMSKTYKEPPQPLFLEEDTVSGEKTLQPASSLLNEATYNPQVTLKHYKYLPHPPPVLPGPSVLEEVLENELFMEASKQRRSMSGSTVSESSKSRVNILTSAPSIATILENDLKPEESKLLKQSHSKRTVKGSRSSISRKKSSKVHVNKKKEYDGIITDPTINVCLIKSDCAKPFTSAQTDRNYRSEHDNENKKHEFLDKNELSFLKREKSAASLSYLNISDKTQASIKKTLKELPSKENISEVKLKDVINRSIQCTIFGSAERKTVISPVIHSLLRALAFLLHELNKEVANKDSGGEKKRLLTQIQLILGDLSNQATDQEFTFDMSYSDSKRMEKILSDLQKYIKDTYGTKGEMLSKLEDMKKVFIETKMKEMELGTLNEKLEEKEFLQTTELKDSDLKYPEITLQNKKLESEQLLAEVEFSSREIKNYEKSIAEIEWEIKNVQEKLCSMKKSLSLKSKTEALGKKVSMLKLTNENQTKDYKNKESDSSRIKKP